MHSPDFSANLQAILSLYPDTPLALICATGGRSNYVAQVLATNGLQNVIDVSEGMFGNADAPGWLARELPIVDLKVAQRDHQTALLIKK
jgi:rhodanese-related sulfurtransferase